MGIRKPHPDIYELLCDRLKIPPEHILFVDDIEENVVAAQKLGFQALLGTNEEQIIAAVSTAIAANHSNPTSEA